MDVARVKVCSRPVEASTVFAEFISMHSDDPSVEYLVSSFELIVPIVVQAFIPVFVTEVSRYVGIFGCHVDSVSSVWGTYGSGLVVMLLSSMQGKVRGTCDAQTTATRLQLSRS